jgi:hypothetical protein
VRLAGFKLCSLQPFSHIPGHHDGFDSELFETVRQERAGSGLLDIDQGDSGGSFSAARRRRENYSRRFLHGLLEMP